MKDQLTQPMEQLIADIIWPGALTALRASSFEEVSPDADRIIIGHHGDYYQVKVTKIKNKK